MKSGLLRASSGSMTLLADESAFTRWPADWHVVAFPHEVSLDDRLVRAVATFQQGQLHAGGVPVDDFKVAAQDPLLAFGPLMRLSDASGRWEALCSAPGGFVLLGGEPEVIASAFPSDAQETPRSGFADWVTQGGVGFGDEGLAFAQQHLLPRPG